jgi:hypothetical protein
VRRLAYPTPRIVFGPVRSGKVRICTTRSWERGGWRPGDERGFDFEKGEVSGTSAGVLQLADIPGRDPAAAGSVHRGP